MATKATKGTANKATDNKANKAKDVPAAKLNESDAKREADTIVVAPLNAYNKANKAVETAEKNLVPEAIRLGEALIDARSVFKANGHGIDKVFKPWAVEFTGTSKATVENYIRLAENKARLDHAVSVRHAIDIIKGNADEDGTDAPTSNAGPGAHPRLTDEKRIEKILAEIGKLDDAESMRSRIIDKLDKLAAEPKAA